MTRTGIRCDTQQLSRTARNGSDKAGEALAAGDGPRARIRKCPQRQRRRVLLFPYQKAEDDLREARRIVDALDSKGISDDTCCAPVSGQSASRALLRCSRGVAVNRDAVFRIFGVFTSK